MMEGAVSIAKFTPRRRLTALLKSTSISLGVFGICLTTTGSTATSADPEPEEALTGFNNTTNGFESQQEFDRDRTVFEDVETILPTKKAASNGAVKSKRRVRRSGSAEQEAEGGGLGPVYNGTSCVGCHQTPVTGSSSQVSEIRAGHHEPIGAGRFKFVEAPGGSLIHQRAIDAAIQEHVPTAEDVRTLRMSTNTLGNGFVEVIPDADLLNVCRSQKPGLQGFAVVVPVAVGRKKSVSDGNGDVTFQFVERIGRFGWKSQEASLVNFSAGAYLNEMGITSPLQPKENTSMGRDVSQFDLVEDPEDEDDAKDPDHPFGADVKAFARFMRSTKAPPRDFSLAGTVAAKLGEKLFLDESTPPTKKLGCAICHHPTYTTPKPGTPIKPLHPRSRHPGSDLPTVPRALGNKIIHPYSDFLLHDIGTGDGIAQTQHAQRPARGAETVETFGDEPIHPCVVRVHAREVGTTRVLFNAPAGDQRALATITTLDERTIKMIRTPPLWGLRVRPQLLHNGSAFTLDQAILAHNVRSADGEVILPGHFIELTPEQKEQLRVFLNSL